jgi:hypothetical protein
LICALIGVTTILILPTSLAQQEITRLTKRPQLDLTQSHAASIYARDGAIVLSLGDRDRQRTMTGGRKKCVKLCFLAWRRRA